MVATAAGDEGIISKLRVKLEAGGLTLPQKYRILTSLRNCSNASATAALLVALRDPSALFRHDVAFALGQRQDADAIGALTALLEDPEEHCMVRHEAGEALGAIGTPECLAPVLRHAISPVPEVRATCELAQQRLGFFAGQAATEAGADAAAAAKFQSVDPTPPFPSSVPQQELVGTLADEAAPLFDRYRALFALRDCGGGDAVAVMAQCLGESRNALLKHEIAYVLGQMQDRAAVQCLRGALADVAEHAMVRHEAAEALGSIADDACISLLREYVDCEEPIVADSCIIALDMIAHEKSGAFEYADMGAED